MSAFWDDAPNPTQTQTREQAREPLDVDPTALVHTRGEQLDVASLARAAQALGTRDYKALIEQARVVGTMLGADLDRDTDGHVTGCSAFYSWKQGGKVVEGPTIDLMEALADLWGRLVRRVEIVSETPATKDAAGAIELQGVVVDLLTLNVTIHPHVGTIMPAPGKYADKPEQAARWHTMQMQAANSKAIRNALEHAIPRWLTQAAMATARVAYTKAVLGNNTLHTAIETALKCMREWFQLDEDTLVAFLEQPRAKWTPLEVQQLDTLARDLKEKRTTVDAVRAAARGDQVATPTPAQTRTTAPPPPSSSTPGETTPAAPTSAGGQAEPKAEKKTEKRYDAGDAQRLHDRLRETRGPGTIVDIDVARKSMCSLLRISRISEDRWHAIVHAGVTHLWTRLQNGIALAGKAETATTPTSSVVIPDPWPGPLDQGVVLSRVRADLALIGTPGVREVMDAAGVASLDTVDELGLRRLLCVTTTRLGAAPPERAPFEDPNRPMDPSLQADIEDLVRDTGDEVLCSAARVAGIPVDLAGPMVTPQTPPDQRRQFLATAIAMVGGR